MIGNLNLWIEIFLKFHVLLMLLDVIIFLLIQMIKIFHQHDALYKKFSFKISKS